MSAAETGMFAAVTTGHRPSTRFLRSELGLIFRRRRNLVGLGVIALIPVIIAVAVKVTTDDLRGGPSFFDDIAGNGLFVALAAHTIEMTLFLPLAISAISGDSVAGEANIGTLRYLLTVPVGRTRLLVVKYAAIAIFSFVAVMVVSVVGSIIGLALFGGGDVTLLSGNQVSFGEGLWRVFLATLYLGIGLAALGAIGLFVSTVTEQPIGAMIAVMVTNIVMVILDSIPQLDWLGPYLLTHWWTTFGDLFRYPIEWTNLGRGLLTFLTYGLVFWSAAWAQLGNKDITS